MLNIEGWSRVPLLRLGKSLSHFFQYNIPSLIPYFFPKKKKKSTNLFGTMSPLSPDTFFEYFSDLYSLARCTLSIYENT